MQQPVCSSTHHILSRLYAEPQLILMLSMWYCWWKIKHWWLPSFFSPWKALHLPRRWERPLRGSRITRQLLVCSPFPQMHLSAQTPLILLTYEWPRRIPVPICWVCGRVRMWNEKKKQKQKNSPVLCNKQKVHTTVLCQYPVMGCQQMLNTMESECLFDVMVHCIITRVKCWDKYHIRSDL